MPPPHARPGATLTRGLGAATAARPTDRAQPQARNASARSPSAHPPRFVSAPGRRGGRKSCTGEQTTRRSSFRLCVPACRREAKLTMLRRLWRVCVRPGAHSASEFVGLSKGGQGRPVQATLAAAGLSRRGALQGVEAGGERLHRACANAWKCRWGTGPHRRRGGVAGRAHLCPPGRASARSG